MTTLKNSWINHLRTLDDAYAPRPSTVYLIDGVFSLPSLNILYGPPGTMKSLILADAALSIAVGRPWLPPLPHDKSGTKAFAVKQAGVAWLDFDNGNRRVSNRFEAFGRAYNATTGCEVYYVSMPDVPFDAQKTGQVVEVIDFIKDLGVQLVVFDNLLTISGAADENSPEIGPAMMNLRLISEKTQTAVVIVHHSRKATGIRSDLGDDLRGHNSIRGAVDLALRVKREPNTDVIAIESTKTRDVDVEPFGAIWTYTHKPGTKDLDTAAFFGQRPPGIESSTDIEDTILLVLKQAPAPLNQTELIKAVKAEGIKAGRDRIRGVADSMVAGMRIRATQGARNAVCYAP